MTDEQLHEIERYACKNDTREAVWLRDLLVEVSNLKHAINDPLYQYAGSRISRYAIVTRDARADNLWNENAQLKKRIEELEAK